MPILIIAVIVLGLLFLAVSHSKKEKGGNWVQFFAKGKEAGFTFKEIEMLRHLAVQCSLESPQSLFESQAQLDQCIHSMVRGIKMSGEADEGGIQNFLSKLYDYRQKIEIDKPHGHISISKSSQVKEGQILRVLVPGTGVFRSQIVKNNNSKYMTISRPAKENFSSIVWMNTKISVYFWREDDAGYVFDSEVLDEVYSAGIPSLKITQGASLFRTQKRRSIRAKMHKAAFLYLVPADERPHKLEMDPGLKCFLEDISDTGCALTVGGRADAGLRVKVQFALGSTALCMTGTVRSVNYSETENRSILHIEAESMPSEARNHILGEVFGMLPNEGESELPFRVIDNEMANVVADGSTEDDSPEELPSAPPSSAPPGRTLPSSALPSDAPSGNILLDDTDIDADDPAELLGEFDDD